MSNDWKLTGFNCYGGQVYRHPDGFHAIENFNYYHQSVGFEVFEDGPDTKNEPWNDQFIGRIRHFKDLP